MRTAVIGSGGVGCFLGGKLALTDEDENRPSELEYQSGAVVRVGKIYGISTSVHAYIYACLLRQEARAREQVSF